MTTNTEYNNKFKSHLGEGGSEAWKYCGMSGGPWCCAEVSLVAGETNKKLFYGGRKCTYCPTAMAYDKAHYARLPMYLAMGGDRIYFDWNGNGVPDHIGEVDYRISTEKIATVEGNTGSPARVRKKERPAKYVLGIYRPEYKPATMPKKEELTVDGSFEFKSIYMLQLALGVKADCVLGKGTVKTLQKKAGVVSDGDWGAKTSKAVQKMIGAKVDGAFGKESVKALQKWVNKAVFGTTTKPTTPTPTPTTPKPTTTTPTNPTTPTKPTGKYVGIIPEPTLKKEADNIRVGFLQRFLNWYNPLWKLSVDNDFGAKTESALKEWQKLEGLTVDGEYGTKSYEKAKSYLTSVWKPSIEVDKANQICTIYNDGKPIMSEFVSTARKGYNTPTGNYKIQGASGGRKAKLRTALMSSKKSYAEFLDRFYKGKCMHTVPCDERQTTGHVNKTEFNKLGTPASVGCVRMLWYMAKFVYEKCAIGTPVKVIEGKKGVYPMGKPIKYKATSNIDPTYFK